jgi:hypothetical protein
VLEINYFPTTKCYSYIVLPCYGSFYVESGKFKVFANAGFYYGYIAVAWVYPPTKNVSHSVSSDYKRSDFGLAGGLGFLYKIKPNYSMSLEW